MPIVAGRLSPPAAWPASRGQGGQQVEAPFPGGRQDEDASARQERGPGRG